MVIHETQPQLLSRLVFDAGTIVVVDVEVSFDDLLVLSSIDSVISHALSFAEAFGFELVHQMQHNYLVIYDQLNFV
jgi:hypothetical protein